jgi:dTDP-4-dehydrorhamnose reductase
MTKPRILILGSSGQLGVELGRSMPPGSDVVALSRKDVDLTDESGLRGSIRRAQPNIVINAAAYTAVDRAESEPGLARAVNTEAPRIIAEECLAQNAWLLHFSTDYVFNGSGERPWKEDDVTGPLNVYGQSKLDGEQAIATIGCDYLIFRTSWVYAAHGNNFLRTMLRLGRQRPQLTIVDDQFGAPTTAAELAHGAWRVVGKLQETTQDQPEPGIYHMTCAGATSWYGFAKAIFACVVDRMPVPEVIAIPSEKYPTPAARPRNSTLNCDKLERTMGIRLARWEDALTEVIRELGENLP